MRPRDVFRKVAHATAAAIGSPYAFLIGILAIAAWAVCGPLLDYSNTWQLVINTCTTITTFLAVFLIQNTQNRDSQAIHLKLDELIRSAKSARNELLDVEELPDEELARLEDEFRRLRVQGDRPTVRRARHKRRPRHARPSRGPRDQPRDEQGGDQRAGSPEGNGRDTHEHDAQREPDAQAAGHDDDAGRPCVPGPRRTTAPR